MVLFAAACSGGTESGDKTARVRNEPPAACSSADFAECPALEILPCDGDSEPVIDYSSDCCPHFSCQPVCVAAEPCEVGPAPTCPAGTTLWIGTAIEDCCPAYRCEPDAGCDSTDPVACPASMPWCGDGVEPIYVGTSADCCPIYQCPCEVRADGSTDPSCGCTYPSCGPGEQLICLGDNICGYPCECQPAVGQCQTDEECDTGQICDTSSCLPDPGCDPATGMDCTTVCWGVCKGYVVDGCDSDIACPSGQHCELLCMGWGCVPPAGGGSTDECTCPPDDWNCVCNPDGSCSSETCTGQCVPDPVDCTAVPPGTCPMPMMPCDDPAEVGIDPATCCPIWECPSCTPVGAPCFLPDCEGAIPVGTDPWCCPIYCCPGPDGACVTPAGS